ncbi:YitT family protein [Salinisphaera sp. Q1T1-3]|uniref:YitT family protein n=1 Tax=Salinisphaera sp. Q1T1-3 TaxID=2321229 RepID=UPI000E77082A|nr:YitT family protein [Salinisphaera sp. Q1T1-3]RJS91769.1 YitT family protein [Salinisphaera sp. Q1T1-3]
MPDTSRTAVPRHARWEDALAMLLGVAVASLGLFFYAQAQLLIGSTAGMALLICYVTGWSFGPVFFVINLPFYGLAYRRMGWPFTIKTFLAVAGLSALTWCMPHWVDIDTINLIYAALAGGALIGLGILLLFRHRASLGGVNILALYIQDRYDLRAGHVQLVVDAAIMVVAFFVLPWDRVVLSVVGAVVLNMIVAINHRADRYLGQS